MEKTIVNCEKYDVYLSTVSAGTIRTLSEALKEVLTDVNMYFDSTGIRIMCMDGKIKAYSFDPPIVMHEEGAIRSNTDIPWEW